MAIYRKIHTSFWSDPFTSELEADKKLFYLYLLTNEKTKQCGIYEISKKQICFDLGYSIDKVCKLLEYFIKIGKIKYSEQTNEVAIKNWTKYNYSTSPKVITCIQSELKLVKNRVLIEYINSIDTESQEEEEETKEEEEEKAEKKTEEELPHNLRLYISKNFPNVSKLKTQLSNKECIELLNKFGNTLIDQKLKAMENSAQLTKKNLSVYLTLTNWCNKDKISQLPTQPLQNVSPPSQYKRHEL
jgi:hypothetical protein